MIEKIEYADSYGVPGSGFMACMCCSGGGAPGVPLNHDERCPVEIGLRALQSQAAADAGPAEQERTETPRWIVDATNSILTERQPDGSYKDAYRIVPIETNEAQSPTPEH